MYAPLDLAVVEQVRYIWCILLRIRYIWGAGVRFFPGGEGGGVALDGVPG